jgi:uncharacterized SAM-binding protein YcdF (DUF218 family)
MISQTRCLSESAPADEAEAIGWRWRIDAAPASSAGRPWTRTLPKTVSRTMIVACLAAVFVTATGFLGFVGSLDRFERYPASRADGIVALTGGAQRIGDAIDLLAKGYGTRLLISGVNERTSRDEIARLNPGQRRLFECCVDLDYRARNTIGNAVETRRWMEDHRFRSLIVVTSNYHMPRTLLELDSAMPEARKVPFAVVNESVRPETWWKSVATAKLLASEYVKYLAGWVRTRLDGAPTETNVANRTPRPVEVAAKPWAP